MESLEKKITESLRQIRSILEQTDEIISTVKLSDRYQIKTAMSLLYHIKQKINIIELKFEKQNSILDKEEIRMQWNTKDKF